MKVKTPGMNSAQVQSLDAQTRIAEAAEARAARNDTFYNENMLPRVMAEMERQGKISQDTYDTGTAWAREDRGRADRFYDMADAYDPVTSARTMATGLKDRSVAEFQQNADGAREQAVRGLALRGKSAGASGALAGRYAIDMALGKTQVANNAERAGLMAVEAAKAEKLNVMGGASGRFNPGAGMSLAMGGAGMGMQGIGFAQGSRAGNDSSWGSGMGMAQRGWGEVGASGDRQQQMKYDAGRTNAGAFNSALGAVVGSTTWSSGAGFGFGGGK